MLCTSLTAITMAAPNAYYSSIDGVLFDASQATLLEFPPGLEGSYAIPDGVAKIGTEAFFACSGLTNITLGTVTDIGFGAFENCGGLNALTVPDTVTNLEEFALSDCGGLTGVYFQGNPPGADSTVFADDDNLIAVYYLPGASGWSGKFAGIDAIEVPASCQVTVSALPGAGGTVGGGGTFAPGDWQTVTASANPGYSFDDWTENGFAISSFANYGFTVSGNRVLVANFSLNPVTYNVSVSTSSSTAGTVGGGGTFVSGTSQTVTATANSGYTFANWTENGVVVSSSASYTLTLDANRNLVANFVSTPFTMYVPASFGSIKSVTSAEVVGTLVTYFGSPAALAVDHAGNIYAAAGEVYEFTPAGVMTTFASGFSEPTGLAFDTGGNLYVADFGNGTISKVTPAGVVSPFASGFTADPHLGGNGTLSVACDGNGNVFVADYDAGTVTKLTPDGARIVFANGVSYILSMATDVAGNVYLADFYGAITKITPAGMVSTFANVPGYVTGLAIDEGGNLYASSTIGGTVSMITTAGVVSTFVSGYSGPIAIFSEPAAPVITMQPQNQGFIKGQFVSFNIAAAGQNIGYQWYSSTDDGENWNPLANNSIYSGVTTPTLTVAKVTSADSGYEYECEVANKVGSAVSSPAGLTNVPFLMYEADEMNDTVCTITPSGNTTLLSDGLSHPLAFAFDPAGNIYVANQGDNTVSMIAPDGVVSTFASGFYQPSGLAFDGSGNLYVANGLNNPSTVSMVTPAGVVSTYATGFAYPSALAFDGDGNLYVANVGDNTVSKVTPAGAVSIFAAGFGYPAALAFDGAGNLYVANWESNTVSQVTPAGVASTFASGFNGPISLAFDGKGNLYVANSAGTSAGGSISKVTPTGTVTQFSGAWSDLAAIAIVAAPAPPTITMQPQSLTVPAGENALFSIDVSGTPAANTFQWLISRDGGVTWTALANNSIYSGATTAALTVADTSGISSCLLECVVSSALGSVTSKTATLNRLPFLLYVANATDGTVSQILPDGTVNAFASGFYNPSSLAVDANGNVYVGDDGVIYQVTPAGILSTFASGFSGGTLTGLAVDASGNLYAGDEADGTVYKITPAGVISVFASGFGEPEGLAFDANGNLYVADYDFATVSEITPSGVKSKFASGVLNPIGLAFDAKGNLYVANVGGYVYIITPAGVVSIFASDLYRPQGLALDGEGNLYVAGGGGSVELVTPAGLLSSFADFENGELTAVAMVTAPIPVTTTNYTIAVSVSPGGGGTISGGGILPAGSYSWQTVTATADNGYLFANWTVNGNVVSSSAKYNFTLEGNVNLVANFNRISFQTLDDPLAVSTYATGISEGRLVGYFTAYNGSTYGFLYNSNTYSILDDPLAYGYTAPSGISGGNIVGSYSDGSWHGFIYNAGNYTTYSYFDGLYGNAHANAIDGTNVVGSFPDDNGTHGFLYNGNTYTTLDDPNSYPIYEFGYLYVGTDTSANGISGGAIVGSYNDSAGTGEHGFLYANGKYTTLDAPNGFGATCANGIDGGNIVGYYTDGAGATHGFFYNGGNYDSFDDPNGIGSTYALGISGNSIVGYYTDSNRVAHGFIATITVGFTASPTNGSIPLAVQFTSPRLDAAGNAVTSWYWHFGDGSASTNQNPSHVYTNAGTFLLSLAATNSLGSAVAVSGPAAIIASLPTAQFGANLTNGPAPLTVEFSSPDVDVAGNAIVHWHWYFGDGSTGTNQNPSHVYAQAGTFFPSLIATNALGITVLGTGPAVITANPVDYLGLVLNGGFESGDFTGWVEIGDFTFCGIGSDPTVVHSGHYGAELGTVGALSYLSQTLSTVAEQSYVLSFWLDSPDGQTPNEFLVSWNGTKLFDQTNLGTVGWTNLQFTVKATNISSVLEFGFRNDPSYFGLDDINVAAVTALLPPLGGRGFNGAGGFLLSIPGVIGQAYTLQSSTNLVNWVSILSFTCTNSPMSVVDPAAGNYQHRFYRLAQ
jgi:sugar lactone lactonase YvrE